MGTAMPASENNPKVDHFSRYREAGAAGGALVLGGGRVRGAYAPVVKCLQEFSPHELKRRHKRLIRAVAELGLQDSQGRDEGGLSNSWRLDPFPVVLEGAEWQRIEAGVIQRAKAFNAYAADLYGAQTIIEQKIIPPELALGDPAFLRQLSGIEAPGGLYSQFGAFDLLLDASGVWRVLEHHMDAPFGVSHVLQNRRILSQIMPELFECGDVAPVAGFSTHLLEMLRAQSSKENPHVLLLTSGPPGRAYFEEAFIARHMGISIAQPGDLLVRESRVFLKTIRGLEAVDVIYRRVNSAALDPIAMPGTGSCGVPGLINVVRKGNVAVVNAPGAGVADNRGLLRYADQIISHYLSASPILRSVETFRLGDPDQKAYVDEHMESMQLKPMQAHDSRWQAAGSPGSSHGRIVGMEKMVRQHPEAFVAQRIPARTLHPRFRGGRFEAQAVSVRVFYILGPEPMVLPGGMATLVGVSEDRRPKRPTSDGRKDVWVPDPMSAGMLSTVHPTAVGHRFSIGSRVAESLYWAGRYLERAENTARQFTTLEQLRRDQLAQSGQQAYWPLLQAVAVSTGQHAVAHKKQPPAKEILGFFNGLLLDAGEGASARSCINNARAALENVRERISPECRELAEAMVLHLAKEGRRTVTRASLREVGQRIVRDIAGFNGTAERTMPHDDSWQFYRIGVFFERAVGTLSLLEVALPGIMRSYREKDEESADLTALLRLLGSLDAYRREFRSRAYLDRVGLLILQGNSNPGSIGFCLHNLRYAIGTLSISEETALVHELQGAIDQLLERLAEVSLAEAGDARVEQLDSGQAGDPGAHIHPEAIAGQLAALTASFESIHERIEDIFFSHQNVASRTL